MSRGGHDVFAPSRPTLWPREMNSCFFRPNHQLRRQEKSRAIMCWEKEIGSRWKKKKRANLLLQKRCVTQGITGSELNAWQLMRRDWTWGPQLHVSSQLIGALATPKSSKPRPPLTGTTSQSRADLNARPSALTKVFYFRGQIGIRLRRLDTAV